MPIAELSNAVCYLCSTCCRTLCPVANVFCIVQHLSEGAVCSEEATREISYSDANRRTLKCRLLPLFDLLPHPLPGRQRVLYSPTSFGRRCLQRRSDPRNQ